VSVFLTSQHGSYGIMQNHQNLCFVCIINDLAQQHNKVQMHQCKQTQTYKQETSAENINRSN